MIAWNYKLDTKQLVPEFGDLISSSFETFILPFKFSPNNISREVHAVHRSYLI